MDAFSDEDLAQVIKTARLSLIPQRREHASEMSVLLDDDELHTFIGETGPRGPVETEARYANLETRRSPDGRQRWLNWVLQAGDGRLVGYVQATVEGENATLAWIVGTVWQNRGFATEAARAMLEWLTERGVSRFLALIHPANGASRKVAQGLGLANSGVLVEGEEVWTKES